MNIDPKEIQKLLDKEAIRELSHRYARGMDRHDAAMVASCYHPDAIDDHGAYIGTTPDFIKHAFNTHKNYATAHHHYIVNHTVELDGDTAHGETYFLSALRQKNGKVNMGGGRYVDRYERRDGRWAIAARICLVEWNAEVGESESAKAIEMFVPGKWDKTDPSYQRPLKVDRPHRNIAV